MGHHDRHGAFVVKTVGILILAPIFCISAAGGWDALVSKVPEAYLSVGSMGFDKSFAYIVLYVPGLIIGQDIWQRIFTAKNEKVSKTGTVCAGVYSVFYALATVVIGMSVFVLLPHLDNPQNAFVVGVSTFSCRSGCARLILAAAMAATISVSSGTILGIVHHPIQRPVPAIRSQGGGPGTSHLREVTITASVRPAHRRGGDGVLAVD